VQKHNEKVFTNTLGPMFIFKVIDINHPSCPPSYELLNDLSKTTRLHFIINIKKDMCCNYATYYGLVNGTESIFKTLTCCEKTIITTRNLVICNQSLCN